MRPFTLLAWLTALVIGMLALQPASSAKAWDSQVIVTYSCHYGHVTANLGWSGAHPYAYVQYVEMSYVENGWQPHTTTSVGPFHPSVTAMSWDGLAQSTRHFLRFTQQFPDGSWDSSLTYRFDTPSCGAEGFTVTPLPIVPTPGAHLTGNPNPYILPGDYDCAWMGGDGPNFIYAPAPVDARDIYDLDYDGDFVGCEPGEGY